MSIFLQWASYSVRSKERIISDLFSYLSPRWYPNNIIGSGIYDIFDMYAEQLSSSSVEVHQTFDDLSLNTVRTTPITGYSTSKIYDNFGSVFLSNKLIAQNNELYNNSTLLSGYRQQLKFLSDAYLIGSTIDSVAKVGQGYSGVSPIILEPFNDHLGWKLTSFTASVVAVGKDVVVLDNNYPGVGNILYTDELDSSLGKTIYYSRSRLGYNTRPVSKQHYYSGLKVFIFGSASVNSIPYSTIGTINSDFKTSIENITNKVSRTDINSIFFYSDNFVYDRYTYGDTILGDQDFVINENGYVYNDIELRNINTPTGSLLRSKVVRLPSTYTYYDWFYDWATLTKNDAYFIPQIRSYATSNIPDSVYFKDIKQVPQGSLMLQIPSGSIGAHWVFQDVNKINDITGNNNNLNINSSLLSNVSLMRPREGLKLGIYGKYGSFSYSAITDGVLNFYNKDFFSEAWVYGIDKSSIGEFSYFIIKRQETDDFSNILTSSGYMFSIDGSSQELSVSIRDASGNIYKLTCSVAQLFNEEPQRPHYFAGSYNNGLCFIYLDGKELIKGICPITPPDVTLGYTYIHSEGINIGVDEVTLASGQLLPQEALSRFNYSKPYQLNQAINRLDLEQYHQLQLEVHASGSAEFEYHQFSVRGIDKRYLPSLSLEYITGKAVDLIITGKPVFYVENPTNMNLYDFTGKPLISVQGQSSINNLYSDVEYIITVDKSSTIEITGKPIFTVPGQSNINNLYADVELLIIGSIITTEDGNTITTEDGTSISLE
jgi:hypothetical protein